LASLSPFGGSISGTCSRCSISWLGSYICGRPSSSR
jgi:hypothetical protein